MVLKLKHLYTTKKGQALVESVIMLLLLISIISGFFVYLYRTSIVIWSEYNLNQAIHCETSVVLQTKKYLAHRKTQGRFKKFNSGNQWQDDINRDGQWQNELAKTPHRKNRNCLAKAKADIQKITPWEKIEIKRNKSNDEYEVNAKWDKIKIMRLTAKRLASDTTEDNTKTKALWSQIFSSFSR